MAIVSIHMPLRIVSGSPTALDRPQTVEHEVAEFRGWACYWEWERRPDGTRNGRHQTDAPTGEMNVVTMCGKQIEGLVAVHHQTRRPCELCTRTSRERRTAVVIHPPFWEQLQQAYITEQLRKAQGLSDKRLTEKVEVTIDVMASAQMILPL